MSEAKRYHYTATTNCAWCDKSIERKVSNLSSDIEKLKNKNSFCCPECRRAWHSKHNHKNTKKVNCRYCNKEFESNTRSFCSKACYSKYASEHPEEFNLINKMKNARSFYTAESLQKSLDTRKKNGYLIDWESNPSWKRYFKKCAELTIKMRPQMIIDWDGFDFYDNEYIFPYLSLHHTDRRYPTLDHRIPKSLGFRLGLTPYEITSVENLVWTKRILNSRKRTNLIDNNNQLSLRELEFDNFIKERREFIKQNKNIEQILEDRLFREKEQQKARSIEANQMHRKAVNRIDKDTGEILEVFESIRAAEHIMMPLVKSTSTHIPYYIKTGKVWKGYKWSHSSQNDGVTV